MLHLENFFEKSFALLLTTPRRKKQGGKNLKIHHKHDKIVGKKRRKLGERQIKR